MQISAAFAQTAAKQKIPKPVICPLKNFYADEVFDDRTPEKETAQLPTKSVKSQIQPSQTTEFRYDLPAIKSFIQSAFTRDQSRRPILIHLKDCSAEERTTAGKVEGKMQVKLTFDLKSDEGEAVYLTDYQVETKYTRIINGSPMAENIIRQSLTSALVYLDNWLANQSDHNPKLAKEVKVFFRDYHEKTEGDTIYYAANRPLKWEDFQEKPRNSKYAATVFPSFGFDEQREVVNGVIRLYIDLKIYVPKSACWVKDANRDDYTLNHEQRHFDLVEIIGKQFEQKIRSTKLPVNNFDGPINVEFYNYFREMNLLQKKYDDETQHGINSGRQKEWDDYIEGELLKFGIAKTSL